MATSRTLEMSVKQQFQRSHSAEAQSPSSGQAKGSFSQRKQRKLKYCQIEGCGVDLREEPLRNWQVKTCRTHQRADVVPVNGVDSRYCQQCVRFHPLDLFDGDKRGCRDRLERHNRRRQLKNKKSSSENKDAADVLPVANRRTAYRAEDKRAEILPPLDSRQAEKDDLNGMARPGESVRHGQYGKRFRDPRSMLDDLGPDAAAAHKFLRKEEMNGGSRMADYWGAADERFAAGASLPADRRMAARLAEKMGHNDDASPPQFRDSGRFSTPPLEGEEIRRRAVISDRRAAADFLGSDSRFWVPGGYPPPYGGPSDYAGWMDEVMADRPGMDPSVIWWRHMQESMRRYAPGPHEGVAPFSRHLPPSMQSSRMAPAPYDSLPPEEMGARRPRSFTRPDLSLDNDLPPRHLNDGVMAGLPGYLRHN